MAVFTRCVYSVAWLRTLNANEALDVTQEVFVAVLKGCRPATNSVGIWRAWLARLARNQAISVARTNTRRTKREQGWAATRPEAVSSDLSTSLSTCEELDLVLEALTALRKEYRDAITLFYLGGLSHEEVAAELGHPVGTVASWIARARDRLRNALQPVAR